MLIDTHTHLFSTKFDADRTEVVERALQVCSHLMLPNVDEDTIAPMNALAAQFPGRCLPMVGLHPTDVAEDYPRQLDLIAAELEQGGYYGVGETGLDLYWDKTTLPRQQESLRMHLEWAKLYNLPIILHTREANAETLAMVEAAQDGRLRGIFHCFSGTIEEAQRMTDLGFCLGIGGTLTYKNSPLPEVLRLVDPQYLVLETDSPYLAPVPHRGKRNESSYIAHVAERLAEVLSMPYPAVAELTTANAGRMFRL